MTSVTFSSKNSQNFHFCACPSHNALKRDAGGKQGKLLRCKLVFNWIKGNLAEIQPKTHFLQKGSRSQWVKQAFFLSQCAFSFVCKISGTNRHFPQHQQTPTWPQLIDLGIQYIDVLKSCKNTL